MSLRDLKRVLPPKPVARKACVACEAFAAECEVPVGEGAAPMCWNCAHHVVDHGVPLHEAMTAECECTPDKVYPDRHLPEGQYRMVHGDMTHEKMMQEIERHGGIRGHAFNPRTGEIEPFLIPLKQRN